jgi:hypothetical protein
VKGIDPPVDETTFVIDEAGIVTLNVPLPPVIVTWCAPPSSLQVRGTQVAFDRPASVSETVMLLEGRPALDTVTLAGEIDRLPVTSVVPLPPQLPSGLLEALTDSELLSEMLRAIRTVCSRPAKVQLTRTVACTVEIAPLAGCVHVSGPSVGEQTCTVRVAV